MIHPSRRWLRFTNAMILSASCVVANAQEVGEQISPDESEATPAVEMPLETVPQVNTESRNQRQPITKAELESAYGSEALAIMNEQLRQEIELLAREYRESERRNDIQLFGLGAIVALIFLGIGFSIGKRFGGRRLL